MGHDHPTVLMTVTLPADQVTLDAAIAALGVSPADVDVEYGLVPIDPDNGTYALLVSEEAGARVGDDPAAHGRGVEGPFANPVIEPYGPPE